MRSSELPALWKKISRPVEISTLLLAFLAVLLVLTTRRSFQDWEKIALLVVLALVYLLVFFRWLLPRYGSQDWVQWLNIFAGVVILSLADYLTGLQTEIHILFVFISSMAGMRLGMRAVTVNAALAVTCHLLILLLTSGLTFMAILSVSFLLVVYLMAGFVSSAMAATIRQQSENMLQRNRSLSLLLEMSAVSDTLNLADSLPKLAERIVKGLSASYCSIHLLESDGSLLTLGVHPMRPMNLPAAADVKTMPREERRALGRPLDTLYWHQRAIQTRQMVITRQDVPALAMSDEEREAMLSRDTQSACLVPILFENRALGVISVGEERKWDREPFSQAKLDLLLTIAAQSAVVVNNVRMHQATREQVERMAVINEVTRAISSTIEMSSLLELIYQQIRRVIPAETYYVGLYSPQDPEIDLRIIIDDGVRFSPMRVPISTGLASYVISQQKPVLLHNISAQAKDLPVNIVILGHQRQSESWLGVPIPLGEGYGGVLAVASYQANAFSEDDVALLANVAGQAALALNNARHHAEVEEQSRRDSLTGVYNHSYFLKRLDEEVEAARQSGGSLAMIMLDIDHFKKYNDTYGHVTGDEVLRLLVYAINQNIQAGDVVGRWGGEEFCMALPSRTADDARRVAEMIRETMFSLPVFDNGGNGIPGPTVSQGITAFPERASSASQLVDIADRALYEAKKKGRDQIHVAN